MQSLGGPGHRPGCHCASGFPVPHPAGFPRPASPGQPAPREARSGIQACRCLLKLRAPTAPAGAAPEAGAVLWGGATPIGDGVGPREGSRPALPAELPPTRAAEARPQPSALVSCELCGRHPGEQDGSQP